MTNQILFSQISLNELKECISELFKTEVNNLQTQLTPPPPNEYLTRQQAKAMLSISLVTLGDWTKKGIVQSYRVGTRVRYKRTEVEQALNKTINLKTKN